MIHDDNILVSCIVPVYCAEEYLHQCVDSILAQDYPKIEVILVDDGSTDCSGDICDDYQSKYSIVKVIHQENRGVSAARNQGVRYSSGEYIAFIDADDWLEPQYISYLVRLIKQYHANIAILAQEIQKKEYCISNEQALEGMLYQTLFDTAPWGKLFHKSIPISLPFPEGMFFEDLAIVCQMIAMSDKVSVGFGELYHYRKTPSGTMNGGSISKLLDERKAAQMMFEFVSNIMPKQKNAALCRKFSADCQVFLKLTADGYETEKNEIWQEICKGRAKVLLSKKARLKNRIAALISYFGKGAIRLLWKIQKL